MLPAPEPVARFNRFTDLDRIAELEARKKVLVEEIARLKEENKLFGEMHVEWQRGGFAEVIRGKDEVIATLKTRIERECTDKASWRRSAEFYRKAAGNG